MTVQLVPSSSIRFLLPAMSWRLARLEAGPAWPMLCNGVVVAGKLELVKDFINIYFSVIVFSSFTELNFSDIIALLVT